MPKSQEQMNNEEYASAYASGRSSDFVRREIATSSIGFASDPNSITGKGYRAGVADQKEYGYKPADDCGSGESSSDSCCYITSACLDDLGLPRSSLEMKAMKLLTKDHILKSFRGKRDYITYGRRAPIIVQKIRSRTDAQETWTRVYETLKQITATILSGRYKEGHQQYKSLVLELEDKFAKPVA